MKTPKRRPYTFIGGPLDGTSHRIRISRSWIDYQDPLTGQTVTYERLTTGIDERRDKRTSDTQFGTHFFSALPYHIAIRHMIEHYGTTKTITGVGPNTVRRLLNYGPAKTPEPFISIKQNDLEVQPEGEQGNA